MPMLFQTVSIPQIAKIGCAGKWPSRFILWASNIISIYLYSAISALGIYRETSIELFAKLFKKLCALFWLEEWKDWRADEVKMKKVLLCRTWIDASAHYEDLMLLNQKTHRICVPNKIYAGALNDSKLHFSFTIMHKLDTKVFKPIIVST